ncbi:hypothetical protein [Clostridium butyricum]|uniref:Uncharacterized protein n=1 Tax=Clostridium butyricum TaxID=1492 RepID=A0A2S7FBA9_CLOBU|nr:hypothetical protein [Clostridium butyricum]KHD14462.1 hypothetical protein OA81_14785 [Clostridium butyricum]PPV15088.1 hypothetical protein AWN73_12475 [Clostridium butyricum]
MIINDKVLNKINKVEVEEITDNLPILYEFILDQGYTWLKKQINYSYSSEDLVEGIKYIIDTDISNLDLKYCMYMNGIEGHILEDGTAYYPIKKHWYYKMKQWSEERRDKNHVEAKYKRMKEQISAGTLDYRFI